MCVCIILRSETSNQDFLMLIIQRNPLGSHYSPGCQFPSVSCPSGKRFGFPVKILPLTHLAEIDGSHTWTVAYPVLITTGGRQKRRPVALRWKSCRSAKYLPNTLILRPNLRCLLTLSLPKTIVESSQLLINV